MSASTFKRFTQSVFTPLNFMESAAAASPAIAKFNASAAQASAGFSAEAADAVSLHAAAASSWEADAKAMGLAAVPW